jgi:hypothetical protein
VCQDKGKKRERKERRGVKVENDYETQILNIIYGNSHFEPAEYCFQIVNNSNGNIQKKIKIKKNYVKN